jgi:hypothetical protein
MAKILFLAFLTSCTIGLWLLRRGQPRPGRGVSVMRFLTQYASLAGLAALFLLEWPFGVLAAVIMIADLRPHDEPETP